LGLPASLGEVTVVVLLEVETIKTGGSMKVDNFTRILLTIIAVALSGASGYLVGTGFISSPPQWK
jgi:hypothetical protein